MLFTRNYFKIGWGTILVLQYYILLRNMGFLTLHFTQSVMARYKIRFFINKSIHTNKGPSLTVVKTNTGHLFGGYTSLSWHSNSCYTEDTKRDGFLFMLTYGNAAQPQNFQYIKIFKILFMEIRLMVLHLEVTTISIWI